MSKLASRFSFKVSAYQFVRPGIRKPNFEWGLTNLQLVNDTLNDLVMGMLSYYFIKISN